VCECSASVYVCVVCVRVCSVLGACGLFVIKEGKCVCVCVVGCAYVVRSVRVMRV